MNYILLIATCFKILWNLERYSKHNIGFIYFVNFLFSFAGGWDVWPTQHHHGSPSWYQLSHWILHFHFIFVSWKSQKAKSCHIRWMTYFWRMCKWKWHSVHLAYFTSVVCVFGKEIMLYKCRYGERINIKCLKHLKTFYSYLTFLTMVIGNEAKFTKISGLFIMQWCLYEWCPIKLIDKWYGFLKL